MYAPILNDYKQEFFWRRLPQTLLGGPKLRLGYDAPAYVYVSQLVIFIMPWLLGGVFTVLTDIAGIDWHLSMYIYGSTMVLYVLAIQMTSLHLQSKSTVLPIEIRNNILADDDEILFTSFLARDTWQFIVPVKKYKINIVLHALLSGFMCGTGLWYLMPSTISTLYDDNLAASVVVYMLGWLTLIIAQYSLTVAGPPESAIYRSSSFYEIESLSRPFYVCCFLAVHILAWFEASAVPTNAVLHVIFIFLPILWTFSLLSPVDAFCIWLLEQVLVLLYGGSAMASHYKLLFMFLASTLTYITTYFLQSDLARVTILAAMGYLLSTDLLGLVTYPFYRQMSYQSYMYPVILTKWALKEGHLVLLLLAGTEVAIAHEFITLAIQRDLMQYLGYVILGLCGIIKLLGDVQSVYIFFGLLRNPLYPPSTQRMGQFKSRKKGLNVLGVLRRVLLDAVSPLTMLLYIVTMFPSSLTGVVSIRIVSLFGLQRAFRAVWQNSQESLLDLSVFHIVSVLGTDYSQTWLSWPPPVQVLVISLCRNRALLLVNKLYYYFVTLTMAWVDKKQRHPSLLVITVLSVVLLPLVLVIISVAAILDAPLMPLFTLPLFTVGFPRPNRFWPEAVGSSANVNTDTVFYDHLTRHMCRELHTATTGGSLGAVQPGDNYLLRFQDRLAWMLVLEKGCRYIKVNIKGLELQETSCHTVEATRIDDILEYTFEKVEERSYLNPYPVSTLTPCDAISVNTYSDAKNVLTGIIDSPDTLRLVSENFIRTLVWVIVRHCAQTKSSRSQDECGFKSKEFHGIPHHNSYGAEHKKPNNRHLSQSWSSLSSDVSEMKIPKRPPGGQSKTSLADSVWEDSDSESLLMDTFDSNRSKPNNLTVVGGAKESTHISTGETSTKTMMTMLPPSSNKQTRLTGIGQNTSPDDLDALLNDLDMMPAVDVNQSKFSTSNPTNQRKLKSPIHTESPIHKVVTNPKEVKTLPSKWIDFPVEQSKISQLMNLYSPAWFKHVLKVTNEMSDSDICGDTTLTRNYARLVMACYGVVNVFGCPGGVVIGPSHVYKVYMGDIPWSLESDWLTDDEELYDLVIKAYRYAVKMSIDQVLLGEATCLEEYQEYLEDYDLNSYIGCEKDTAWGKAIQNNKENLFSLGYDPTKATFSSRLLTRQDLMVTISRLNSEAVRGQWANQNTELLYFTNDDEERYSIQAHSTLLRNLTVQAADPPLGYPIYSSEPISLPSYDHL